MRFPILSFALAVAAVVSGRALADEPSFSLTLKDHHFTPDAVELQANMRTRFMVKNLDATPAEFESDDFSAEKIIPAGQEIIINIPPLKPGSYEFHDEYHEAESKSRIVVK